MGIVFFCQSCGARFEVEPRMAGKKGRCKKCGQQMAIPRAEEIASMSAMPALALAGVGAGNPTAAASGGRSIASVLKAGLSQIGLAPITLDRAPIRTFPPSALDDAEDSKPYILEKPVVENRGPVRVQDNVVVRLWRRQLGSVQKFFRVINQTAYLISIPFLMILLFGIVVRNRHLALLGATAVVLFNIARLVAGGANLAVVPFRDGINLKKMKKPILRVVEPTITIGLVVLAFTFIPWLSTGKPSTGTVKQRILSGAESLGNEIKGEVNKAVDKARTLDVEKLQAQAQRKLEGLSAGSNKTSDEKAPSQPNQSAQPAVRDLIKGVGERARETVREAQQEP